MEWRSERMKEIYESRLTTVEKAYQKIKPGDKIYICSGVSEPQYLARRLGDFPANIADTEILHLISLNVSPVTSGKFRDMFRLNTFFIGKAARNAVSSGEADYTPIFLSEIPKLIRSGRIPIDVALVQVTPPDAYGNCSLGVAVETVLSAIRHAKYVIAQVNRHMPWTLGNGFVSVESFHGIIEYDEPILEYIPDPPDEISERIGFYVSRLIPNGSTIQAGIGAIPNAVLKYLKDKKHLGVHTEMFSDGLIDLWESGAIDNSKKTLHPGKIIASFCLGTKRLYDTIHNNPIFEFHPTDYISDPRVISQNDGMCAINSALEIDLTGQVCSDSIGHRFYSGIGGQADFIRGAALAKNGHPIIALPSTAKGGEVSRIVPMLSPGAGVVTTRGDVHYVVTEYGIAYLHGKNIRERAMALINISHPKFRASLLEEAKKLNYVYPDQILPKDGVVYPDYYFWQYKLKDEREVNFRPIRPIDEDKLRRFFYGLRQEDVYYRFMGLVKTLSHAQAQPMVVLDYDEKFAIVGTVGEEPDDEFVAVGRWFLDRPTNRAEVAFTVLPDWQNQGIGRFLLQNLVSCAQRKGIRGFTAEVLAENKKMLRVFTRSGFNTHTKLEYGVYSVEFDFDRANANEFNPDY
jgi:acyl-CoA hydrolase/GNAT superfamily N-acetyltransferase